MYFFISQECKEGKHRLEQGVLRGLTKVHTSLFQTLYHRRGLHSCFCKEFEVYYTSAFDFSLPLPPPPPPQATSPHQSQHSTVDVGQLHDPQTYTQHAIQVQHIQVTEPTPATQSSSQVFHSSLLAGTVFPTSLLSWHITCAGAGDSLFYVL